MYVHICVYIERGRGRETNKCRNIDRDRSAQLVVKHIFGFTNSLSFLVEACNLAAIPVFIRKVNSPASPSTG